MYKPPMRQAVLYKGRHCSLNKGRLDIDGSCRFVSMCCSVIPTIPLCSIHGLPWDSYLGHPVVSRVKKYIGGSFFGENREHCRKISSYTRCEGYDITSKKQPHVRHLVRSSNNSSPSLPPLPQPPTTLQIRSIP